MFAHPEDKLLTFLIKEGAKWKKKNQVSWKNRQRKRG
jgi:hypothetical protein